GGDPMFSSAIKTAFIVAVTLAFTPAATLAQTRDVAAGQKTAISGDSTSIQPHEGAVQVSPPKPAEPEKAANAGHKSLALRVLQRDIPYGEWVAAQVFLVICGILAALI